MFIIIYSIIIFIYSVFVSVFARYSYINIFALSKPVRKHVFLYVSCTGNER